MKRVYLVTGAAGHLARTTIARLLRQDCFIRGLILPWEPGISDGVISYYPGDVTKPDTLDLFFAGLEGCEVIVLHMAAMISIQDKVTPELYDVNVNGTRNIIKKCKQYHVKRLLYVSSVHAIREPFFSSTITEVQFFSRNAVKGAYAATKAEATQLVLDAGKDGLDVVVVHPSAMIGPGDAGRSHMMQFMQMYLHHKLPASIRGGYDFVDVRDVAEGIIDAVDKGRSGECYLLTNRYVTIRELLGYMRIAAGRKSHLLHCPLWMARAALPFIRGYAALTRTRPVFTNYSINVLQSNGYFCHDKATMEFHYHPRDIKDTVVDTVAYLQRKEEQGEHI